MADTITIDAAGRLVIPKAVRDRFRLSAGTPLSLTEEDGRIVLTPEAGVPRLIDRGGRLILDLGLTDHAAPDHLKARDARLQSLVEYALKR